ncbi:unnamed protein product [Clonostachys chloroleuca]|uniref:Xylanolytic transcriptional activator regulatory domain-containing protein n=1 Tax=Clonostachys chloroleuca TaxID=1926264 RepID=A0AA35MHS0_9HYPO|nr:unnamed protein product [Clonostachys chloroleuca]
MSSSQRGAGGNPHGSKRPPVNDNPYSLVDAILECLVEDPATGLHRPRDYMQSLESRVAYLESLLQQVRPDVAVDHYPYVPSDNPPPPATVAAGQHHRAGSQEPEQEVDGLSSDVALLCLSAAGREPHYFGPSSALSFSRIVSTTLRLTKSGDEGNARVGGARERLDGRRSPTVRFPPPDLAEGLVKAYFNNIHPQYPFLHRPTFNHWQKECMEAQLLGELDESKHMSMFFTLMSYYHMALDYIAPVLDLETFESVQAILCCAVYSVRSPVGVSLWKISGMAIRQCIELGYHRNVAKFRRHADPLTAEISKRIFWVAYDLDRAAGLILGRPFGITDSSVDVELPLDVDDESITRDGILQNPRSAPGDPPTAMTGALHNIRLRKLWSKMAESLYLTISRHDGGEADMLIDRLRQELEDWRLSIPDQLILSADPLSVFASRDWFQLAYEHSILLLYRHYIIGEQQVAIQNPVERQEKIDSIFEECAYSARQMCMRYRRLYQSSSIQFTWGSLHILFLAGLTYLFCLWRCRSVRAKTRQTDVMNTCMACTMVLTITAERWSFATRYRDIFELLSVKTISMVCGETTITSGGLPGASPLSKLAQVNDQTGFQDWLTGINDFPVPEDSEWLVEELLHGIREFDQDGLMGMNGDGGMPFLGIPNEGTGLLMDAQTADTTAQMLPPMAQQPLNHLLPTVQRPDVDG